MHYPQLVIYEGDGRLAQALAGLAATNRWALRQPRRTGECLEHLAGGGPAVLVLKTGRDLEREFSLLERAAWLYPWAGRVAVGDFEQAALEGLAWDLGADYVLFPPRPRDWLPELVVSLMDRVGHA